MALVGEMRWVHIVISNAIYFLKNDILLTGEQSAGSCN